MPGKGTIGKGQFFTLVVIFTMGSSVLIMPAILAAGAGPDAWLAAIVGITIDLLLIPLYLTLGRRFSGRTFPEYAEAVLGKWPGMAVSLLYFSFFVLVAAMLLRDMGDFIAMQVLPNTPIVFVELLFLLIIVMAVRLGLEPIARSAEIFLPWIVVLLVVLFVLVTPYLEFPKMLPVLENGVKPVIKSGLLASTFQEYVLFLMLMPYIRHKDGVGKAFFWGAFAGGASLVLVTLACILVLGPGITSLYLYPVYVLAERIDIAEFLSRIQIVVAGTWFLTIYFKTTLFYYSSVLTLAQTLRLKDYRAVTLPLGLVLIALSISLYPNTAHFLKFIRKDWLSYSYTYMLVLPLLLLAVDAIRRKRAKALQ